ncbi:farnesol dehydrogenase-like isoform X4 [Bombus huntii]|uniref:farnesol dehydrogenase-like isoform X4 n=1 Tax=Bombus huntii TaxID=85661 RepID=UPI0021AA7B9B|nr:farnesol dehydrogenase-like isoform X4 [Bombus huntii]
MNYWSGKVAIVTGASRGIGLAISKELAKYGINVIGLARSMDELVETSLMIGEYFFPFQCDVTDEDEILVAFKFIEEKFGGVDILVNNAGIINYIHVMDSETDEIHNVINTNLIAPAILAREAIQSMRRRYAAGHIINITGITGLYCEAVSVPMGIYGPSKFGLKGLGIELRHEISQYKLKIKVTTINPGFVRTDMSKQLNSFMKVSPEVLLNDRDIADAVIYALGTPKSVEISEITVLPHCLGSDAILL